MAIAQVELRSEDATETSSRLGVDFPMAGKDAECCK